MSVLFLTACSGSGGSVTPSAVPPVPTGNNGGAPPPVQSTPSTPAPVPTATPFAAANVRITEYPQPDSPLYVAAGPDGSAYFGNGANGSGSNLYRFNAGALSQTQPAPPPSGYDTGGGVYGITVTGSGAVYWLSAYFGNSLSAAVTVECGASGTATLCEPSNVDEPTSMLVDAGGTFWLGGLASVGGGQIATSNGAAGVFSESVMQLVNGPDGAVWGVLENDASGTAQYAIAQFRIAGSSIVLANDFPLSPSQSVGSMTAGADGAFWFTDYRSNAIGRMDLNGHVQEFPLHEASALPAPWYGQWQIATACDGAVWFSEPGPNKIGRVDTHGTITEFALQHAGALPGPIAAVPQPRGVCSAPQLWVGEQHANALAAVSF